MPERFYGGSDTYHDSDFIDVETDDDGRVTAVWFRCQPLPFRQDNWGRGRSAEMREMYRTTNIPRVIGVTLEDG